MQYVFSGDKKNGEDGIFKIAFDILINEPNLIQLFRNLLTWQEDESHEFWGFSFYDEYDELLDEVSVRYLDEEKKYSKEDFHNLLITAVNKYFSMFPEGKEEIDELIN